ncbi:hypothetical protein FVR03_17635 [Pontibacter qinzhouensis]|uniref:Uncharacterized protein n=1 Tax=Pontibacter qinzhouensis TaxID=2603253 RepID=A0A5C8JFH9_9BACT|nr:hypothetical protein [Pontibacter qinzhouensis]TXK36479.1 hypothetical protein FVR03_17635 [Pontibacter qinzhouensis]
MVEYNAISFSFRHILLSVSLLWALLLYGQDVAGYCAPIHTEPATAAFESGNTSNPSDTPLMLQHELSMPNNGLAANGTIDLQQPGTFPQFHAFAAPTDDKLPAGRLRFYGISLLARLFPIIIQPNAP